MRTYCMKCEDIESIPLVEGVPVYDENGKVIEGFTAIREYPNRNRVLAINSSKYATVQNREIARAVLDIVGDDARNHSVRIDIVGQRRKMYISGLYKEEIGVRNGDGVLEYHPIRFEVVNSYDATTSLRVNSSLMRMQCLNVLYGIIPSDMKDIVSNCVDEQQRAIKMSTKNIHKGNEIYSMDIRATLERKLRLQRENAKLTAAVLSRIREVTVTPELKDEFIKRLKMPMKYSKQIEDIFAKDKPNLWFLYQAATYVVSHSVENPERREMFGQKIADTLGRSIGLENAVSEEGLLV